MVLSAQVKSLKPVTCQPIRWPGLRVVGIYDLNRERAEKLAAKFGVSKVYRELDEMLNDPDVRIVDLAVPAKIQPELAERVAAAGKHMLCQKPLAESYSDAVRIDEACERYGIKRSG